LQSRSGERFSIRIPASATIEVPIILEEIWTEVEVAKWEKEFKKHAKFILQREI
jgi:hypothetical protein